MKYICSICGYVYDEAKGIPEAGIAPGTPWSEVPADWSCPMCGAEKSDFEPEEGAPVPAASAAAAAAPKDAPAADARALSPREVSALCSNLAKGCEKQYQAREAALFSQLADYFRSAAAPAPAEDLGALLALVEQDLSAGIPAASAAANAASPRDRGALRALTWNEKVSRILKSLLLRWEKEGAAMLADTGVYVCTICGFVMIGDAPPALCPVCKVPGWKFERMEGRAG